MGPFSSVPAGRTSNPSFIFRARVLAIDTSSEGHDVGAVTEVVELTEESGVCFDVFEGVSLAFEEGTLASILA
jgi:hypothetical protein